MGTTIEPDERPYDQPDDDTCGHGIAWSCCPLCSNDDTGDDRDITPACIHGVSLEQRCSECWDS